MVTGFIPFLVLSVLHLFAKWLKDALATLFGGKKPPVPASGEGDIVHPELPAMPSIPADHPMACQYAQLRERLARLDMADSEAVEEATRAVSALRANVEALMPVSTLKALARERNQQSQTARDDMDQSERIQRNQLRAEGRNWLP